MLRLLIWILIGYIVYRMIKPKLTAPVAKEPVDLATETFQDPVCGVYISEDEAVVGKLEGKRYHFCSHGCLEQFEKNLQRREQ
jgi:YHS domain-containing protein